MSWSRSLTGLLTFAALAAVSHSQTAADDSLWREFGLVQKSDARIGAASVGLYRMKDLTGALAAWEWRRLPDGHACTLADFCTTDGKRTVLTDANYLVELDGSTPKPALDAFLQKLPNRHNTSLPAIVTFIPVKNLVPNSARYILGPEALKDFAPQLTGLAQPGFDQGAEAQVAEYKSDSGETLHLALFYYPTPEMARIHVAQFKKLPGVHAKRSGVLVGLVYGGASDQQANSLLSRIEYEAKVTWNDVPPPSPIKPLYQLLWNIIYLSGVLVALCLLSGLIYAGIRLYRRRFGTLEEDEAMTVLHLSRD